MAVFDVVVNNADRKGDHVFAMGDGHRYGVDHGLTLHSDHKLRTVLWGWIGEALSAEELAGVDRILARLEGELGAKLAELLTDEEIEALAVRCARFAVIRAFSSSERWNAYGSLAAVLVTAGALQEGSCSRTVLHPHVNSRQTHSLCWPRPAAALGQELEMDCGMLRGVLFVTMMLPLKPFRANSACDPPFHQISPALMVIRQFRDREISWSYTYRAD